MRAGFMGEADGWRKRGFIYPCSPKPDLLASKPASAAGSRLLVFFIRLKLLQLLLLVLQLLP